MQAQKGEMIDPVNEETSQGLVPLWHASDENVCSVSEGAIHGNVGYFHILYVQVQKELQCYLTVHSGQMCFSSRKDHLFQSVWGGLALRCGIRSDTWCLIT